MMVRAALRSDCVTPPGPVLFTHHCYTVSSQGVEGEHCWVAVAYSCPRLFSVSSQTKKQEQLINQQGKIVLLHKSLWSNYNRSYSQFKFSSVAQSCPTLCNLLNHSIPGLPVHYQLPEPTQTHVHLVGDAIQTSQPLSSPSPATNPSHPGLISFRRSSQSILKETYSRHPKN